MIKRVIFAMLTLVVAMPAIAQDGSVVATKPIRAGAVVELTDVQPAQADDEIAQTILSFIVGKAVKRSIYPNMPISVEDVVAPRTVERNEVVRVEYQSGFLLLSTDGRTLEAGAVGDTIRVMNLSSKSIVAAEIVEPGKVVVK